MAPPDAPDFAPTASLLDPPDGSDGSPDGSGTPAAAPRAESTDELRRLVEALRSSRDKIASIFRAAPTGIGVVSNRVLKEVNDRICAMTGYAREELLGQSSRMWYLDDESFEWVGREKYDQIRARGTGTVETRWRRKDGTVIDVLLSSTPIDLDDWSLGVTFTALDITQRKRAEAEREQLQAQLLHAQKMESVGRLAGGVAHDFNNMLQAILGNVSIALEEVPAADPLRETLEEIQRAAVRSTALTRQLLAFARRQAASPRVLDLNDTVSGMLKMLQRLIGEQIRLVWRPGPAAGRVRIDPSQLDQVLANLTVNARDAIAGTGTIVIDTGADACDAARAAANAVAPGEFVTLAVRDTGCGMDALTRAHLFEPFYTTKGQGLGTGLGLATVYGIVRQNGGFIEVDSEPGRGTTMTLWLPQSRDAGDAADEAVASPALHGTETILVVEDEEQVLALTRRVLEKHGYAVLAAASPDAALQALASHPGPIGLLITDVVMPGMNGRSLCEQVRALRPGTRCLFVSGYAADVIAHEGVGGAGVRLLQKPFASRDLLRVVRDILDAP